MRDLKPSVLSDKIQPRNDHLPFNLPGRFCGYLITNTKSNCLRQSDWRSRSAVRKKGAHRSDAAFGRDRGLCWAHRWDNSCDNSGLFF